MLTRSLLFVLLCAVCGSWGSSQLATVANADGRDSLNADSLRAQQREDSLEQLYEAGALFYPTIIRLKGSKNGYFYSDTVYNGKDFLTKDSCEAYYAYALKKTVPNDLKVHKIVWGIKEIQQEAGSNWAGYMGVFSMIEGRPGDDGADFYRVSIKRQYPNRFGRVFPIGFLRIKLKPLQIMVNITVNDTTVSLDAWRHLPDSLKD